MACTKRRLWSKRHAIAAAKRDRAMGIDITGAYVCNQHEGPVVWHLTSNKRLSERFRLEGLDTPISSR